MEHTRLGDTGLKISWLALGCMSYGDPATERAHQWALADDDAQPFFRQAIELGITFWDTANTYQAGTSEEVVGRAIRRYSRREDIVLAAEVFGKMHDGPGGSGLSRKAIMEQIDAPLTRLGTDYVDLYQIHRFDPGTPVAETMEALHDIVKAGKVRYLGASSMYAWQFAKLQHASGQGGWTRFVSMQNQYNLLRRQDEPELMDMCADTGVGLVPYSPKAKAAWHAPGASSPPGPASTTSCRPSTHPWTSPSPTPAASPWPRSRSPGCCATRPSAPRSSARPDRITCPKPSSPSKSPTATTGRPGTNQPRAPAQNFTGDVYVDQVKTPDEPSRLIVGCVRFTPAARTNWRSQALGQTLHRRHRPGRHPARNTGTEPGWIGIDWCPSPTRFALNFGSPARVSAAAPASCCYRYGSRRCTPRREPAPPSCPGTAAERAVAGPGRRVLVVGCGVCDDPVFLARLGCEVIAFDVSATAVAQARRRFAGSPVKFAEADLLAPPPE